MKINIESPQCSIPAKMEKKIRSKFNQLGKMFHDILSGEVSLRIEEKNNIQRLCAIEAKPSIPDAQLFAEMAGSFETALKQLTEEINEELYLQKPESSKPQ